MATEIQNSANHCTIRMKLCVTMVTHNYFSDAYYILRIYLCITMGIAITCLHDDRSCKRYAISIYTANPTMLQQWRFGCIQRSPIVRELDSISLVQHLAMLKHRLSIQHRGTRLLCSSIVTVALPCGGPLVHYNRAGYPGRLLAKQPEGYRLVIYK